MLQDLAKLEIPCAYTITTLCDTHQRKIHIFPDASINAIAAVAYLKVIDSNAACHIGFITGKAKLAPVMIHTIPRLELGAWVEVQFDQNDLLYVYIDRRRRRRKFLITTLLRAFGYSSDSDIIQLFYTVHIPQPTIATFLP